MVSSERPQSMRCTKEWLYYAVLFQSQGMIRCFAAIPLMFQLKELRWRQRKPQTILWIYCSSSAIRQIPTECCYSFAPALQCDKTGLNLMDTLHSSCLQYDRAKCSNIIITCCSICGQKLGPLPNQKYQGLLSECILVTVNQCKALTRLMVDNHGYSNLGYLAKIMFQNVTVDASTFIAKY